MADGKAFHTFGAMLSSSAAMRRRVFPAKSGATQRQWCRAGLFALFHAARRRHWTSHSASGWNRRPPRRRSHAHTQERFATSPAARDPSIAASRSTGRQGRPRQLSGRTPRANPPRTGWSPPDPSCSTRSRVRRVRQCVPGRARRCGPRPGARRVGYLRRRRSCATSSL